MTTRERPSGTHARSSVIAIRYAPSRVNSGAASRFGTAGSGVPSGRCEGRSKSRIAPSSPPTASVRLSGLTASE